MPGFHAIMVVRDEADILPLSLSHLMSWADSLAIMDTGSTDGTWEILHDFARRDRRITVDPARPQSFHNGLRAVLFDRNRSHWRRGDWICRVDADEIYHVAPPPFVRERVGRTESMVCALQYVSALTREACDAWRRGEGPLRARGVALTARIRHFRIDPFPEQRLYRYRPWMYWPDDMPHPYRPGRCARERIPVLHYRTRDPEQAARRQALRRRARASGATGGMHWNSIELVDVDVEPDARGLLTWEPGQELPHAEDTSHLAPNTWVAFKDLVRNGPIVEDVWDLCTRARARFIGRRSKFPTQVEPGADRYSFAASAGSEASGAAPAS